MQRTSTAVDCSKDLLRAVRTGGDPSEFEARLADYDPDALAGELGRGDRAKAFWLNVYNAFAQLLLERDPELYDSRRRFFGGDHFAVAGTALSLDDVEHGIVRRSQWKYGLGYVRKPDLLVGEFETRFRLADCDPRVHFALNCGAESCPPIAVYTAEGVDDELDTATASYLHQEVEYDPDADRLSVPRLLLWYRGDFGGKSGILELLGEHDLVPADARPRLKHTDYDWTVAPGNWADG